MINVLKLNPISNLINKIFDGKYDVSTDCANPDVVLVRSAQMADFSVKENLIAVGRAGAGVNNIPFADYIQKGIVVFNTPGANANAVKELVLSALLLSCRKIVDGISWSQSLKGKGDEVKTLVEKGKSQFIGGEILCKTLGIVGLGAIGRLVADSAIALGMNVLGYDPFIAPNLNPAIKVVDSLESLYASADFITIHVPFMPSTKGFINAEAISKMKDGVAIINAARGELVNNDDIKLAIDSGKVSRYFTDFPTDDLLQIQNVIPCPHLGASTPEAEDNCAIMVAQQLVDFVENGNIKNSVNYPNLSVGRVNGIRITILCSSQKDILNDVTAIMAKTSVNALSINSAVKGDAQYIIIDTDTKSIDSFILSVKALDSVYRVRII
ncbi:MAG: 3-phosphoglycerate dehydrogenase family protein [Clostridia bacterium]